MTRARIAHRQRAQVLVIFPIAVLMLLGIAAMAIDGGRMFLGRQELQKAAEAAALDGALAAALANPLNPDPASNQGAVQSGVTDSVAWNLGVAGTICQPSSVSVDPPKYQGETMPGTTSTTAVNGVYVRISCSAQFTAAALIPGLPSISLGADAEAVLGSADGSGQFVQYDPTLPPYPRVLPPPGVP